MNIHEYQAKEVLRKYGVPVPEGIPALNPAEIEAAVRELDTKVWVVKAQIHAGGRGKAGGVKLAKTKEEAISLGKEMFGKTLVTHQTGPEGQQVRRVYIESGSNIDKEYYLSIVTDRSSSVPVFIVSSEGGMDIEEVAEKNPEKIIKVQIKNGEMMGFHARQLAFALGLEGDLLKKFVKVALSLYKAFIELDCDQVEINPLVKTKEGDVVALDAKVNFDDNALYRHKDLMEYRDEAEEDPLELRAKEHDLSYVKMDGNIGCMVNGAGLAMSTMDIIKYYGAEPANFLDVGGGATKERVSEAFKIILSDKNVSAILVNIFGGIMKCDIIAEGIIAAVKDVGVSIPLVVRLAGTNFELGKKLLAESGLEIVTADDLDDAAQKAVNVIKK
ncbi:MAG: ADP-forming succinate--CoA ligase subunit beta [Alphaproteobacteria bacterium]|nr:ADP-forming succinate--CoA ligase subunit beta [Alphaproteobacteria bacterium]